jgi:hypothetical protein
VKVAPIPRARSYDIDLVRRRAVPLLDRADCPDGTDLLKAWHWIAHPVSSASDSSAVSSRFGESGKACGVGIRAVTPTRAECPRSGPCKGHRGVRRPPTLGVAAGSGAPIATAAVGNGDPVRTRRRRRRRRDWQGPRPATGASARKGGRRYPRRPLARTAADCDGGGCDGGGRLRRALHPALHPGALTPGPRRTPQAADAARCSRRLSPNQHQ